MARNDQFPVAPKLPPIQEDVKSWLTQLSVWLQFMLKRLFNSLNLIIQGYLYVAPNLTNADVAPSASTRGRLLIVNGSGATPDHLYLCIYDGTGYSYKLII